MVELVEKIIEHFEIYELFNNIIPGTVYVALTERATTFKIKTGTIWVDLVIYYFIGLIMSRIGSQVIEKIMRKHLKKVSYEEFVKAEQKDSKVRKLSMVNNIYRTYIAVLLGVVLSVGFNYIWTFIKEYSCSKPMVIVLGCIGLMILFGKSYVKQTDYVRNRTEAVNSINKVNQIILPQEANKESIKH